MGGWSIARDYGAYKAEHHHNTIRNQFHTNSATSIVARVLCEGLVYFCEILYIFVAILSNCLRFRVINSVFCVTFYNLCCFDDFVLIILCALVYVQFDFIIFRVI